MPATIGRGRTRTPRGRGRGRRGVAPAAVLLCAACLNTPLARASSLTLTWRHPAPGGSPALVLALDPAVSPDAPSPAAPNPASRVRGPRIAVAFLDTTLMGAAFGLADRAGFYRWDHTVHRHTTGIWGLARTPTFPAALIGGAAVAGFWEGGESRVGRTLWQGLDGAALAGASTSVLKYAFGRERPSQTGNPDEWFKGAHAQSFPSGDVSAITGLITPAILEYRRSDPAIYALAALPVFDMAARVQAQGHWQTDVLGGAVVGVASGYFTHGLPHPIILSLMPHGVELGLKRHF